MVGFLLAPLLSDASCDRPEFTDGLQAHTAGVNRASFSHRLSGQLLSKSPQSSGVLVAWLGRERGQFSGPGGPCPNGQRARRGFGGAAGAWQWGAGL